MSIEWQMLFGNETPYWIEEETLAQPSPLSFVEDSTSDGTTDDIAKESYKLDRVRTKRLRVKVVK